MKLNEITRGTGLEADGIKKANVIYRTPPTSVLYEQIVIRCEGLLSHLGLWRSRRQYYHAHLRCLRRIASDRPRDA